MPLSSGRVICRPLGPILSGSQIAVTTIMLVILVTIVSMITWWIASDKKLRPNQKRIDKQRYRGFN